MQRYVDELTLHLNDELKKIEEEATNQIVKAEQSIHCVSQCLCRLKDYIHNYTFPTNQEEIYFFKYTKPSIYCLLLYYLEVFHMESRCPPGNKRCKKKYLSKIQKKHKHFFNKNIDFYNYYRSQSTHLDEKYFLRANMDFRLNIDDIVFNTDPAFSTSHDFKVARIMAFEKLNTYINRELLKLKKNVMHSADERLNKKYNWTESKIALVELSYALHANGSINHGTADIKEVILLFENLFNTDLGDCYRSFLEIKSRQHPSKFLEALQSSLIRKIMESNG